VQDAEVLDGFRRYESMLESALTPEEMALYAAYLQQAGVVRIFDDMDTSEIAALPTGMGAVAARVLADTNLTMENRRVVALLDQYGEHNATPDFQRPY
jgi:hypothetical protein